MRGEPRSVDILVHLKEDEDIKDILDIIAVIALTTDNLINLRKSTQEHSYYEDPRICRSFTKHV